MKKNTSSIFVLVLAAVLSVFASCNKLSKATVAGITQPATPDSVILKSRVFVIDSTKLTLVSADAQINQGIYEYTSGTGFPAFLAGDIIIGITGDGYLRKITSVGAQQNQVVLNTVQAKLEDVFLQGNINFSTGVTNLARTTDNSYQYNISNMALFQDGVTSATITSAGISINPNWNFNMQFQNGAMNAFSAICQNGTLNANMQVNIAGSAPDNINATNTLNSVSGRTIIWIGQLPIVVTTDLSLLATVTGAVNGTVNRSLAFTTNDTYVLGDAYASGTWQNQYSLAHNSTLNAGATSAAELNVACSIVPQMSIKIYGLVCPGASIALNESETGNASTTSADWDLFAGFTQQSSFNVSAAILGYGIPDDNYTRNSDTINYQTPYQLIKVSGDGQIGTANQYLAQPLLVQVTDNNGNPQANIPVYFTVTSGGGALSNYTVLTNSRGYAQTNWQIGDPATASQGAQAMVRKANGTQISGSPVSFIAL